MWKLVQWHEYMTQEGINSHLRAHSILSPFVTCTIYKVSCRILCSWVFESPQHAAVITQRHRLVVSSDSKKAPVSFFFLSEKIYYRTTVSRRYFLPLKDTASFHNAFCFHFLLIDVCLMRKWEKKTKNFILWIGIASLLFSKPIIYDEQRQNFALFLLWATHDLNFLWKQKNKVEAYL